MDFNFQVLAKGEAEESDSNDEADPMEFSDAPNFVPLPGEPEIEAPAEAGFPTSIFGSSPSDVHGLEARVTETAQSPASEV